MRHSPIALILFLWFAAPAPSAQTGTGVSFVTVANTSDMQEAGRLIAALTKAGFKCGPSPDLSGSGVIHIQVGPYTSPTQVKAARARLQASGYKLPAEFTSTPGGITAEQADLEAEALAKLGGGSPVPETTGSDLAAGGCRYTHARKATSQGRRTERQLSTV